MLALSAPDGGVCSRATIPIFSLPPSPGAQPAVASGALAFSGGSQYLELSQHVLPVPLRSSTGFSAALTFRLLSMPADSTLLLLAGSTYAVRVRVAVGTQALEFEVDVGGGVKYVVASAAAAIGPATWHTAVVRYGRETHEMQVWLGGMESTQASIAATVRSAMRAHCFWLPKRLHLVADALLLSALEAAGNRHGHI